MTKAQAKGWEVRGGPPAGPAFPPEETRRLIGYGRLERPRLLAAGFASTPSPPP
jgi:hypothetical protein